MPENLCSKMTRTSGTDAAAFPRYSEGDNNSHDRDLSRRAKEAIS